jgi:hypothetical protein
VCGIGGVGGYFFGWFVKKNKGFWIGGLFFWCAA